MDKTNMKISPSERDFNTECNLTCFSDDDAYPNAGLWTSSDLIDKFVEFDRSSSDFSDRTFSSCSWHNDEFDLKSSSQVHASLEAIEDALYENIKSPYIKDDVYQECCDWFEKFPYLRLKGKQINTYCDESQVNSSVKEFVKNGLHSPFSLHIEGKKLPFHPMNKHLKEMQLDADSCYKISFTDTQHTDECLIGLQNEHTERSPLDIAYNRANVKSLSIKAVQDQILEKLVLKVWQNVLTCLEKLHYKPDDNSDFQLPPIVSREMNKNLNLERPKTEGTDIISTEFPQLENLSAFSSVWQNKRMRKGYLMRPSSEMSVNRLKSSTASMLTWHTKGSNPMKKAVINSFSKEDKIQKESECLNFILPVLEEDNQDSSSILRGFHIGPETTNNIDLPNDTLERNNYLPPIVDNRYLTSNAKLTKELFTFYGPSIQNDANATETTKSMKIKCTSRPSTSCKKVISKAPLQKSRSYLTSRNVHKDSDVNIHKMNDEAVEKYNKSKCITLFPIVTPLTPHEDKSKNLKKDLLHNFLTGKKK